MLQPGDLRETHGFPSLLRNRFGNSDHYIFSLLNYF